MPVAETYMALKPCRKGHFVPRYVKSGHCTECHRINGLRRHEANREKLNAGRRARYRADAPREIARASAYNKNNPEWRKAYLSQHYAQNRGAYIHRARVRKLQMSQRSFNHEIEEIIAFYANCPDGYEVDHEIPLNHHLVCGLHTMANLQYLTVLANRQKYNHWEP